MALSTLDRLLTVVVTATLTSAAWIVAGGTLMDRARGIGQAGGSSVVETARGSQDIAATEAADAPSLDTEDATAFVASDTGTLSIPVAGVRPADLTDSFSDIRSGGQRVHEALDIMAPEGTPVVASAPGTIERLFLSEAGGKTIYIRSDDRRTIFYYAHLQGYAEGLKENQAVRRGQRLGTVGSTGNASRDAPHLHFAVMRTTPQAKWWEPATAVNPYPLLARR